MSEKIIRITEKIVAIGRCYLIEAKDLNSTSKVLKGFVKIVSKQF